MVGFFSIKGTETVEGYMVPGRVRLLVRNCHFTAG